MKKKYHIIEDICAGFISLLLLLCSFGCNWVLKTWKGLTVDEVIFHLKAPIDGTNSEMVLEVICTCILPSLIIVIGLVVLSQYIRKKNKKITIIIIARIIICLFLVISLMRFWIRLDIGAYLASQSSDSSFIEDEYVNPSEVNITFPEKKRNLIYIFLESMETTYADEATGGAFAENYIPELTDLANENEDFSGKEKKLNGGYTMPGTTWTMGGLFAQTSGLPLQIGINENEMFTQDTFFSDVVTLGDILEKEGYTQALMIGSDATFGGRKLYFTEHGSYNMWDYNYAKDEALIPKDYKVFWGYEDKKLISFAKEKITELANGEQPFNFTMLTVDTHFEDGYVCEECSAEFGANQYANVMACSSKQINGFIEWIQEQDFYENTTIVLVGDHLTMDGDFCDNVDDNYTRKAYTCYLNSACVVENTELVRDYTTFDMFPTALAALGVEIEGNRLGLGTNLFSKMETLTEQYGVEYIETEVAKKSDFLEKLASLNMNTSENLKSVFSPLVVEFDKNTTTLELTTCKGAEIADFKRLEIDIWSLENQEKKETVAFKRKKENFSANIDLSNYDYTNMGSAIYMVDGEENRYFITELQKDLSLCINDINSYLTELMNRENYSIFIVAMDEATNSLSNEAQKKLEKFGLKESLIGQLRCSYYAVIDKKEVLGEQIGFELLEKSGELSNGNVTYKVVSAGWDAGCTCSVVINEQEYAIKSRGLNIVVYDNETNSVVDTVCFDTYDGITVKRPSGEIEVSVSE